MDGRVSDHQSVGCAFRFEGEIADGNINLANKWEEIGGVKYFTALGISRHSDELVGMLVASSARIGKCFIKPKLAENVCRVAMSGGSSSSASIRWSCLS